jgi:hypothetical protein
MKNFLFALRRTAYVAGALAHAQLACFHGLHSKRGFFFGGVWRLPAQHPPLMPLVDGRHFLHTYILLSFLNSRPMCDF